MIACLVWKAHSEHIKYTFMQYSTKKKISYHDSSVNSGEKSKQISTYTWRESKEIDINLYSTTIVNNYSAKQAVGKKKKM